MEWLWILLIAILIFIGIDYGRLQVKYRRLIKEVSEDFEFTEYVPQRYIMIGAKKSKYIADLASMDIKAHSKVGVGIKTWIEKAEKGYNKIIFDNADELIIYEYETAQIAQLTKHERDNYAQKIFFDYKLPEGAERAVIKQLGLLDYMVNIGICSEKSGGK